MNQINKDKSIKELKGVHDKLKHAEKRISQLTLTLEKINSDEEIQVNVESTDQFIMTEFTANDLEMLFIKCSELQELNLKYEERINAMENEINKLKQLRKIASNHYSNPESMRQMSPKYISSMNIDNSKFLDEVVEMNNVIEQIEDIQNNNFEGNFL